MVVRAAVGWGNVVGLPEEARAGVRPEESALDEIHVLGEGWVGFNLCLSLPPTAR